MGNQGGNLAGRTSCERKERMSEAVKDKEADPSGRLLRFGQTFYALKRQVAGMEKFQRSHQVRIWQVGWRIVSTCGKGESL